MCGMFVGLASAAYVDGGDTVQAAIYLVTAIVILGVDLWQGERARKP